MVAARYIAAIGLVAVSLGLRLILSDYLGPNVPYLQFFPAILIASWYGGFGPGAVATIASALAALHWFLPPAGLALSATADAVSLTLFTMIGVAIAALNGRLRDAHQVAQHETALAQSRAERLSAIINTTVDGIIVINARGIIESFNPGAERLFGYAAADVIGQNVKMLMPSPFHEQHDGYLGRYLSTGRVAIIGSGRQVSGRRADGTTFPLHLSVGEMRIDGQRKFTGMLHDLSARERLEVQLRDQTALARLGEMAAMIAHEVKNPLAGIRGAVQVIGGRLPAGNTDAPMMKEIVARIDSLDAMMKDLLVFARPPKPNRAPTAIVPLLTATAGLLKQDDGAKDVEVEITGASPTVSADGEMLKMVFHNLLINGAHAMNGRGRIQVRVSTNGPACRVAVSDQGPGISPDVKDKIFIPFFTTKRRGSGL
ncbi:MAG TPA: PAS domain S-box protein, partial [Vicinamibacterales bacterium]|nr:PAS domain S-box protein [Vicinamibacterales bacterium]